MKEIDIGNKIEYIIHIQAQDVELSQKRKRDSLFDHKNSQDELNIYWREVIRCKVYRHLYPILILSKLN